MATRGEGFQSQLRIYKQPLTANDKPIDSISNEKPAKATITGNTLKDGDAVYVTSVSNEAVNGYYLVGKGASATDVVTLYGLDGTGIGTVTDAKYNAVEYFNFCDATSVKIEAMKTKTTDATTNCDEAPVTELEKDAGSISIGALWSPDKEVHEYIDDCFEDLVGFFIMFKPHNSLMLYGFDVKITSYSNDGQANEKWKSSVEMVVNGRKRKMKKGA